MKKKIISSMLAFISAFSVSINVYATPVTEEKTEAIKQSLNEYNEIENTIRELEEKIDTLTDEIEPIFFEIEKNNEEIKKLEDEIIRLDENISHITSSIKEQQEVLGERLRATYKSSFYNNYIAILLSSDDFGTLLQNINVVSKIFLLDRELIDNLNNAKQELNDNILELDEKKKSLNDINKENTEKIQELNMKKEEQQLVIDEMNQKKNSVRGYIEVLESDLVSDFLNNINDDKSIDELNNLITSLNGLKNQIKTKSVVEDINNGIQKAKSIIFNKEKELEVKVIEFSNNIDVDNSNESSKDSDVEINNDDVQTRSIIDESVSLNNDASSIVSYAYEFIGAAYVYGATGPNSFDCSGFTQYVFNKFGYSLSRTTYTQVNQGIHVDRENLQPGDLIFTRGSVQTPQHVGIYVGNGKMIHASRPGVGVIVGDIYDYVTARRIIN